jgi:exonuclease VII small subunit
MTWKGQNHVVTLVTKIYRTGVKLTKQAMAEVESQIQRLTCLTAQEEQLNLGKWFVDIL